MANAYLTANSYLGMVIEATPGTLPSSAGSTYATGKPAWIPIMSPQITPTLAFLRDEALRGSPTQVYDMVQGVRHDLFEFKTYLYADTFPMLARSILGSYDAETVPNEYVHVFRLLNDPTTGSQPPTYSLLDFDGANYFTTSYSVADSLAISFGAEVAAEATVKYMAFPYTTYTEAPSVFASQSLSTEALIPSWNASITIGSYTFYNVQSGDITLNRKTAPIFTVGSTGYPNTQAPYTVFAGPLEVTGKFTLVLNNQNDVFSVGSTLGAFDTTNAWALTRDHGEAMVIALSDPNDTTGGTAHFVEFSISAPQFFNVKRTRGKEYTEVEVEFTGIANTTDGGSGGTYSPISITVGNGESGAY